MAGPKEWRAAQPLVAEAREQLLERYKNDLNVVGIGFGPPNRGGQDVDIPACVVFVARKLPLGQLAKDRVVPRTVDVRGTKIETDVFQTGHLVPYAYTARERPAICGISAGHFLTSAGTMGCLVYDKKNNNQLSIISCNHVFAQENTASVGDLIHQPGPSDMKPTPDTVIGSLTRWVNIVTDGRTPNQVDGAIADIDNNCIVYDDMKSNMTRPEDNQPAVGMIFAGGAGRTLHNPINEVCSQLDVELTGGAAARSAVTADDVVPPGSPVQKTGRTTEYTTGRIKVINVTVYQTYIGGRARFTDQIATTAMAAGGDSGSILCRGGTGGGPGGSIIFPFCGFLTVAEDMTGVPFTQEWLSISYARDKYLASTLVGRWLIDTLYLNEPTAMTRAADVNPQVPEDDRAFAQALYAEHGGDMKLALMNPDRDDIRVSEQFMHDAEESLARARKYMLDAEANAVQESIALARQRGVVGKNGRELITMLDDPELLQKLKEIAAKTGSVRDPDE